MNKNKSFVKNFELLRPFLLYIAYGCFHKSELTARLGLSATAFDENLKRLACFLPPHRISYWRDRRRSRYSLYGDRYYGADNYLARLYQSKTLTPYEIFYSIAALQVLSEAKEPLTHNEVFNEIRACYDHPDLNRRTMERYLREMLATGRLREQKADKPRLLPLAGTGLPALSAAEQEELLDALVLLKSQALLAMPGWQLEASLLPEADRRDRGRMAQLRHHHFTRLLDEENLNKVLGCIEEGCGLRFRYIADGRSFEVMPERVTVDLPEGTRYLHASLHDTAAPRTRSRRQAKQQNRFLLNKMTELTPCPPLETGGSPAEESLQEIKLQLACPPDRLEGLKQWLLLYFSKVRFAREDGRELAFLAVNDPLHSLPLLRSRGSELVLLSPQSLRRREQQKLKEALANYEL